MSDQAQTAEQIAAAKAEAKAKADQAKAEAKAKTDAAKAEAKAKSDAAKAEAKQKAEAAKAEVAAKKQADAEAKAKAKAEADAAKAVKKVAMPQSNGVTRPAPETACGKVWEICDSISQRIGQPAHISQVSVECTAAGLNAATTRTQYARWKTFNNVFGPVAKPAAAPVANEAQGVAA